MKRLIVSYASTDHYKRGQARLIRDAEKHGEQILALTDRVGFPSQPPYAFKAHALACAVGTECATALLWADACIRIVRPSEPIWQYAREHGVWLSRNGWRNDQWTADSAYESLFPAQDIDNARAVNANIEHVVAGAFAIDLDHFAGRAFLQSYANLATKTRAFYGPTWNSNCPQHRDKPGAAPCGPATTFGHRHDQSAASVIAWRLGIPLTSPPQFFAYKGGETKDTVLVADGAY